MITDLRDRHRERKHFARAAFVRTTGVSVIPSTLQRLHGFGYNGIVRIHLSTWLVLKLEGSVHSVPRDVTLPSLDTLDLPSFLVTCRALMCAQCLSWLFLSPNGSIGLPLVRWACLDLWTPRRGPLLLVCRGFATSFKLPLGAWAQLC